MSKNKNIDIAADTQKVTQRGYYTINGEKIYLTDNDTFINHDFKDVIVLSPEKLQSIADDDDDFFQQSFYGSKACSFYLIDADSFEAAAEFPHCLVMNFANAHHPGGGFLFGSSAQEESLCRCSTLYASISSPKASEMYNYNNTHHIPEDSDYMLLSKSVCVFRDRQGTYLKKPFFTSVMTVAAPDTMRNASVLSENELRFVIKRRLRYFLFACARNGYRDLILGAWGCGAFGNDPYEVAKCFYQLFFEEKFDEFYDNVVFSILGGGVNYEAFKNIFGEKIEDCNKTHVSSENETHASFTEALYHIPICNHSVNDITSNNLGYTAGVFDDGIPFEAELWKLDEETSVSFCFPDVKKITENYRPMENYGKVIPMKIQSEHKKDNVLTVGMAIRESDGEYGAEPYVDYLVKKGAIIFESEVINGGVEHLTDIEGNDVVCVHISLDGIEGGKAQTNLHFREFPGLNRRCRILDTKPIMLKKEK